MTAIGVLDVVHLIHDDTGNPIEGHGCRSTDTLRSRPPLVKQIPQNLGCHHDDVGIWAHLDIAGQNANGGGRKQLLEIVILLI